MLAAELLTKVDHVVACRGHLIDGKNQQGKCARLREGNKGSLPCLAEHHRTRQKVTGGAGSDEMQSVSKHITFHGAVPRVYMGIHHKLLSV